MKNVTIPDLNEITNMRFRKIIVENFQMLVFLRCIPNTKQLEPYLELAQSNPKVLQERSQKGKVYIRPVQHDLIFLPRKKSHV